MGVVAERLSKPTGRKLSYNLNSSTRASFTFRCVCQFFDRWPIFFRAVDRPVSAVQPSALHCICLFFRLFWERRELKRGKSNYLPGSSWHAIYWTSKTSVGQVTEGHSQEMKSAINWRTHNDHTRVFTLWYMYAAVHVRRTGVRRTCIIV